MKKRLFAVLICLVVVLSVFPASGARALIKDTFVSRLDFDLDDNATVRAIVVYTGDSALDMQNNGLTSSLSAADTYVSAAQQPLTSEITDNYNATLLYSYSAIFNGIAVDTTYGELKEIEKHDGVEAVYLANSYTVPEYEEKAGESSTQSASALGIDRAWEKGYKGQGTIIAVLDTGIKTSHEAFNYTTGVDSVLTSTHVNTLKSTLNGGGIYVNAKIPFAYDYADRDTNIVSSLSHGTSVAGVAAGNNGDDFQGIAPNAQLLGMKIFSDANGSTDSAIYFAAIEDAVTLGADVINMSLGSVNGFVFDYDIERELKYALIMKSLEDAGIFLCCACGNEYSNGYRDEAYNQYTAKTSKDAVTIDYADYGTVNSPSTYSRAISVASMELGGRMSDFSSWGISPELVLKPDITGVGGRIYCPYAAGTDTYYLLSGTSVACPTVSGFFAVMLSYYKATNKDRGYTAKTVYDSIYDTVMSTAGTVYTASNVPFSPRKQGVGLASFETAQNAVAVFNDPIANMGDDPECDGVFTVSTKIKLPYPVSSSTLPLTVKLDGAEIVSDTRVYDSTLKKYYNLLTPRLLSPTVSGDKISYTLNASANTASVTVTITLSKEDKEYLSAFTNGTFVEGYVYFTVSNGSNQYSKIKLTVCGFYGDWTKAPAFETYDWGNAADAEMQLNTTLGPDGETTLASLGYTVYDILDTNVGYTEGYLSKGNDVVSVIGTNLFGYVKYDYDRMAFTTADNEGDCLADGFIFYPALLRNVKYIKMTVSNADTGTVYYIDNTMYAMKNYYSDSTGEFENGTYFAYDGRYMDSNNTYHYLADGTRLKISFETQIASQDAPLREERVYYVYVDNSAPEISYEWDEETRLLKVTARDNRYLSNIMVYGGDYEEYFVNRLVEDVAPGESVSYEFDLSGASFRGYSSIRLEAWDYATNHKGFTIPVEEKDVGGDSDTEVLVGDVNRDGVVDTLDAAAILKFDAGIRRLDGAELVLADVNDDGEVDSLDAAAVLKFDVGMIPGGFGTVKESELN